MLGLIGASSGAAGWIRREDHQMAAGAILAGFLAVAWSYIIAAIALAVFCAILILILVSIGG